MQVDLAAGTADYDTAQLFQAAADALQGADGGFLSSAQTAVQGALVYLCNADTPLSALNVTQAVQFLSNCMLADAATINQGTLPAVGAQTNAVGVTPTGNPTFVWSAVDAAGRALQYVVPETVQVTVTQDNQTGGATKGSEPYSVAGQNAQSNFLSWDWLKSGKYGSGAASSTNTLTDPLVNFVSGGTGNLLVNGAFTVATTANVADNWTIAVGTAGSTVTVTTSGGYITGSGILTMVSDGATLISVTQAFNTASATGVGLGGTPYALTPSAVNNLQVAVYVPYKLSVASPAAGVMTVDLIDGSGTVINDDAGVANSFTVTLTTVADTAYHIASGVFRLPKVLPSSTPYKVRVRQSTAVTSGKSLILSCVAAQVVTQLYPGGPYFAGFRGSTDVIASGAVVDAWTFAVTATIGKLQKGMWRWFNVPSMAAQAGQTVSGPGLIIPAVTSGSATLSDNLVA